MSLTARVRVVATAVAAAALVLPLTAWAHEPLELSVVSSPPQYVSGGDVLLSVTPTAANAQFSAGGKQLDANRLPDGSWVVRGLRNGPSRITVKAGGKTATIAVVNHPISGPVFSGPHTPLLWTQANLRLALAALRETAG